MMEILAGRNAVCEALLAQRRRIDKVILSMGVRETGSVDQILRLCQQSEVPVLRVERRELAELAGGLNHQGVAAQVSSYPYVDFSDLLAISTERREHPFLLALDSLQDPQNVGSILRTGEAVGVHGAILPRRRSAHVSPAVSRASSGAVEHLSISLVTNLARSLDELRAKGIWVVGVEDHPRATDYRDVDLDLPLVIVLGSEGRGMRRLVADKCDLLLRIPMRGHINSLNVSVAGSIVLYQAWNARRKD